MKKSSLELECLCPMSSACTIKYSRHSLLSAVSLYLQLSFLFIVEMELSLKNNILGVCSESNYSYWTVSPWLISSKSKNFEIRYCHETVPLKEEERLAEKRTPLPKPPPIKTDVEKEALRNKMKDKVNTNPCFRAARSNMTWLIFMSCFQIFATANFL